MPLRPGLGGLLVRRNLSDLPLFPYLPYLPYLPQLRVLLCLPLRPVLLVSHNMQDPPVWFNEGLAEYYSSFDIEEDRKAHLGDPIPYHLETLREEKLLPLRALFAVDQ